MKYEILKVGEPRGHIPTDYNFIFDTRVYTITAKNEDGMTIQTDVPICFTKKSIKIHLDNCFHRAKYKLANPKIKVGDIL